MKRNGSNRAMVVSKTQIPEGWRLVPLGEVTTLQRGADLPIQDRIPGSVPVYGSNGVLGTHGHALHSGPGVITGRSGSIGAVYFSLGAYWPLNTTLYVRDFHGNSERFAYYLLSWLQLERFAASTGVPSLNRNFVHPYPVAVPPLSEQRTIAAVLDSIDDAIGGAEAVIAATEQLRDSLLHQLLTRGVPGWHTAWKDVSGLGTIPADWEVVRLGDVGKWLSGGTPSKARPDFWSGSVPWVSPKDMKVRELSSTPDYISEEAAATGSRLVPAGAILVVVRGMILAHSFPVSIACIRCAFNQDIRALVCSTSFDPEYVLAALEWRRSSLLTLPTPSTHGTMRVVSEELNNVTIPMPPIEEQRVIKTIIESLVSHGLNGGQVLERLKTLKDSTADALLTGRVRISP